MTIKPAAGTFAALVAAYRASGEFRSLRAKTISDRQRYLDMIVEKHGHRAVRGCRPSDVRAM